MTRQTLCRQVVEEYLGVLGGSFEFQDAPEDACSITTPFRRLDGETIEVEAQVQSNGRIRLSDMGLSLAYLYVNGLTVTRRVLDEAKKLGLGFGTSLQNYELIVEPEQASDLGQACHDLIQASLAVTCLIQKRRPVARLQFNNEVEAFLISNRVVYDGGFEVQGMNGRHTVRFHVDSGRKLLIQPLSVASEGAALSWAERWAYRFGDIGKSDPSWNMFALLDDRGKRGEYWTETVMQPFTDLVTVVQWSENAYLSQVLRG